MKLLWADEAWEDYLWWKKKTPSVLHRINRLIEAIDQDPFRGPGKPEPLKYEWSGYWSRRINDIAACRYHYGR